VVVLLSVGLALYGALLAGLYVFQRKVLYRPDTSAPDIAAVGIATLHPVTLSTADGLALRAWYLPPEPGRPVIAYLHGNGGHIGYRTARLQRFHAADLGVLMVEYRGYGGNPGQPTEPGLYEDARAGLDFLAAQGVAPAHTVLYGESLGSGVAVRLASERPIGAVILETPYTSIAAVAQVHYPYVPARWMIKDRFDALARIDQARAPLLVLLGGRDVVVPPRFGEALFDAAREPKEIWIAPDGGHEDLRDFGALDVAVAFIERRLAPRR
jgi:fermentation-respiration switch protein FrsA (DUF1100 family)